MAKSRVTKRSQHPQRGGRGRERSTIWRRAPVVVTPRLDQLLPLWVTNPHAAGSGDFGRVPSPDTGQAGRSHSQAGAGSLGISASRQLDSPENGVALQP